MAFSTRTMADADWPALHYFAKSEFKEPGNMGFEFMHWLDTLRGRAGVPMTITSSYRTPEHNAAVGGATDSAHTDIPCNSVDIGMRPRPDDPNWNYSRFRILKAALELGCVRFGTYADGSIHLDRTEDERPAPRWWRVVGSEHLHI